MTSTMKCFVAGTMILTADGLIPIENIKAGDKVIAADADTGVTAPKVVLETYIRKTSHLVHLTICGETIVSTYDHPYYVKDKGFVNACDLWIGAELVDNNGIVHPVEQLYREDLSEKLVTVYNFQVDDFHTYYVGKTSILVHNANYANRTPKSGVVREVKNKDGSTSYTKIIKGKEVTVTYSKDGYPDFSPYTHPDYSKPVKINMTGKNYKDVSQANKAIGLRKTPEGYTWHHLQDGENMILVDRNVHDCTIGGFPHTGGVSITKK